MDPSPSSPLKEFGQHKRFPKPYHLILTQNTTQLKPSFHLPHFSSLKPRVLTPIWSSQDWIEGLEEKAFTSSHSSHLPLSIHVSFICFWSHLTILAPKPCFRGRMRECRECRGLGIHALWFSCKKSENIWVIF